jgi:hypothetical protein
MVPKRYRIELPVLVTSAVVVLSVPPPVLPELVESEPEPESVEPVEPEPVEEPEPVDPLEEPEPLFDLAGVVGLVEGFAGVPCFAGVEGVVLGSFGLLGVSPD